MPTKIDQKIVGYEVKQGSEAAAELESRAASAAPSEPRTQLGTAELEPKGTAEVIQMHERVERPEMLLGSTYKIKTPLSDHALYVTINDIVLNQGTEHEVRRPFEVFINSKNMEHFQWIVALTRIISAVFRKGGDVTFLVEELRSVFDPRGGYFKKGGKYMPSLVAELGDAIESHLRMIGLITGNDMDEHHQRFVDEKRAELASRVEASDGAGSPEYPAHAEFCSKCQTKAVVQMDGCLTCLSCGDSKCG